MAEGVKYDGEKARFDLIPARPLLDLAQVYTMGAKKYDDRNWEKGIKWGRIFAAIMRHMWAFWRGEDTDPESGLPHVVHAAWGCFTLLEYRHTHPELDDRAVSEEPPLDLSKILATEEEARQSPKRKVRHLLEHIW